MVVAQDCGNVDWFIEAEGRPTSFNPSPTNRTLVELLACAGFPIKLAHETRDGGILFFTNAVLCMKQGGVEASIRQEWFKNCGSRFLRPMVDLVRPKVVVALGTQAYQSILLSYEMIPRVFRDAVNSGLPDKLPNSVFVFPVYHCGWRGRTGRALDYQREDWEKIGYFMKRSIASP
jgi:uracil-DNA glycosylase